MVDVRAGQSVTAGLLQALTPQAPVSWDVAWTTSTGVGLPDLGNANVVSQYTTFGRRCVGRLEITFGSTTDFGTGGGSDNWRFSTPVPAFGAAGIVGMGELARDSVSLLERLGCRLRLTTPDAFELVISTGLVSGDPVSGGGLCDAVTPWTWASGDAITFDFQYPTAS